jgi:hypothetical protein
MPQCIIQVKAPRAVAPRTKINLSRADPGAEYLSHDNQDAVTVGGLAAAQCGQRHPYVRVGPSGGMSVLGPTAEVTTLHGDVAFASESGHRAYAFFGVRAFVPIFPAPVSTVPLPISCATQMT